MAARPDEPQAPSAGNAPEPGLPDLVLAAHHRLFPSIASSLPCHAFQRSRRSFSSRLFLVGQLHVRRERLAVARHGRERACRVVPEPDPGVRVRPLTVVRLDAPLPEHIGDHFIFEASPAAVVPRPPVRASAYRRRLRRASRTTGTAMSSAVTGVSRRASRPRSPRQASTCPPAGPG